MIKISMNKIERCKDVINLLVQLKENSLVHVNSTLICICALELLDTVFDGNYDFPIDIDKIINSLDIPVIYQPLNRDDEENVVKHNVVGKLMKWTNKITGNEEKVILIDDLSENSEQRYALAHELAHYLMKSEEKRIDSELWNMPMLFKDPEEIIADVFAFFVLIPFPNFVKEFELYIDESMAKIRTSDWLNYLSLVADMPYEQVAIGYEYIRYVSQVIYQLTSEDQKKKDGIMNLLGEVPDNLLEQLEKMKQVLQENGRIEKLFS